MLVKLTPTGDYAIEIILIRLEG